jgi:hypothetical protein
MLAIRYTSSAATSHVIVAKPEVRNTIHVGDTIVFPLYDSKGGFMLYGGPLRKLGVRAIAKRDLWRGMDYGVPSPRGEAYLAVKSGQASGNVLLTLPKNPMKCVSCRTVHYFVTVLPKSR